MTNEVKIVPKLRFPGFESNWKEEKIKTLFKVVSGTTPLRSKKEYFDKAEVPWVKTTDLNNNVLRITDEKISNIAVKEVNMRILPENTLLIAMYGGFNQIGRTGIISFKSTINQAISALLDIEGKSDVNYLQAYFNYNVQKWKRLAASSRKDPNITKKDVENFKITIPNLKEQKRMGEFFSKLDRQIELEEQKLAKLEEQKKGYMQKVFSQELRFKDENGNDYPEWVEETIPQIIQLITDYVANGSFAAIRENVTYSSVEDYAYVIRLQDASANWKGPFVYTNENAYDFLKKTSLFENDIIMSNVGTVGKFFKVPKMDKPMTLGPNALLFRSESNDMNFLYFYLNSKFFKKKLKRIITPGVQSKVNKTDLKKIAIKMPKLKEQEKIGDFFSRLDEIISKQSQKIGEMKLRKKGFLQKMFI